MTPARIVATVAVLAVVAAACAADPVGVEDRVSAVATGDEQNTFYADDSATHNPPSESYAIRQITLPLARDVAGSFATAVLPLFANHRDVIEQTGVVQDGCAMNPYSWTKDHMRINFGSPNTKWCMAVTFSNPRYTDNTKLVYGQPHLVESPDQNLPDAAFRVDNRTGPGDAFQKIGRSFEVEQSVQSSMSSTMTFDVTVGTETTVGGEYAGASFEASLSTEFHRGFEESKERTTAESKTRTDSFDTDYPVRPGRDVMFTFTNAPLTTTVDYSVDGYYDFDIAIVGNNAANWWWNNTRYNGGRWGSEISNDQWNLNSRYNFYTRCFATDDNPGWRNRTQAGGEGWFQIHFDSLAGYATMFRGAHVDWPRFADHDCSMELGETSYEGMWPGVGDWLTDLVDPERRKIVLTGTQVRTSASSTTLKITDLTGCSEHEARAAADRAKEDTDPDAVFTADVKACSKELDSRKSTPATDDPVGAVGDEGEDTMTREEMIEKVTDFAVDVRRTIHKVFTDAGWDFSSGPIDVSTEKGTFQPLEWVNVLGGPGDYPGVTVSEFSVANDTDLAAAMRLLEGALGEHTVLAEEHAVVAGADAEGTQVLNGTFTVYDTSWAFPDGIRNPVLDALYMPIEQPIH